MQKIKHDTFELGQVWKIGDSNLVIGTVGKLLVHYKHYRGEVRLGRVPVSLISKRALVAFLLANKAVLEAA